VIGALAYQQGSTRIAVTRFVSLKLDADRRGAWFAGVTTDRRPVLVRAEDRGAKGRNDRFRLWLAGVEVTGDGSLRKGDLLIAAP
jgi:hypothetical protein